MRTQPEHWPCELPMFHFVFLTAHPPSPCTQGWARPGRAAASQLQCRRAGRHGAAPACMERAIAWASVSPCHVQSCAVMCSHACMPLKGLAFNLSQGARQVVGLLHTVRRAQLPGRPTPPQTPNPSTLPTHYNTPVQALTKAAAPAGWAATGTPHTGAATCREALLSAAQLSLMLRPFLHERSTPHRDSPHSVSPHVKPVWATGVW